MNERWNGKHEQNDFDSLRESCGQTMGTLKEAASPRAGRKTYLYVQEFLAYAPDKMVKQAFETVGLGDIAEEWLHGGTKYEHEGEVVDAVLEANKLNKLCAAMKKLDPEFEPEFTESDKPVKEAEGNELDDISDFSFKISQELGRAEADIDELTKLNTAIDDTLENGDMEELRDAVRHMSAVAEKLMNTYTGIADGIHSRIFGVETEAAEPSRKNELYVQEFLAYATDEMAKQALGSVGLEKVFKGWMNGKYTGVADVLEAVKSVGRIDKLAAAMKKLDPEFEPEFTEAAEPKSPKKSVTAKISLAADPVEEIQKLEKKFNAKYPKAKIDIGEPKSEDGAVFADVTITGDITGIKDQPWLAISSKTGNKIKAQIETSLDDNKLFAAEKKRLEGKYDAVIKLVGSDIDEEGDFFAKVTVTADAATIKSMKSASDIW